MFTLPKSRQIQTKNSSPTNYSAVVFPLKTTDWNEKIQENNQKININVSAFLP